MSRPVVVLFGVALAACLAAAQVQVPDQRTWGQQSIDPGGRMHNRRPWEDDSAVSATSLAAPRKAQAAYGKAMKELAKGSPNSLEKAEQLLEKAVEEYPAYAAAWTKLGQVKADQGEPDGAIAALERSVELDERYLAPYDALVWLYMAKRDWAHAAELTEFVLGIDPTDVKMRWYQAGCAYETGRDDDALAHFREIQGDAEAAKMFPQSHLFMGLIYARRGEIAKAAADYQLYLQFVPEAPDAAAVKKQLDEWERTGAI